MKDLSMIIFSCNKFSDLWDAHIAQLEKHWKSRDIPTYLVTDGETDKTYENVKVVSAGADAEFTDRVLHIVDMIDEEYVLVTLDDYFLIQDVENEKIEYILSMMKKESLDYVRLYARPKRATGGKMPEYKKMREIDINKYYSVNLYVGVWKKSFLKETITTRKNPWQYEISLYKAAQRLNAKCAVSANNEFKILDVVRKGKVLNKANRYFKRHNIDIGDREICSYKYEITLWIRTMGARHMPKLVVDAARRFMIKRGHHYFSQDDTE